MGFFDQFSARKKPSAASKPPAAAEPASASTPVAGEGLAGGVLARLITAREKQEAHDLPAALAIYEEVLATAGDRADVLVTISADLGENGHIREVIELIAPRYDAERHGPATGLNLLQAYLAANDPDSAQHVLDVLFSLKRPELQERLFGFSNAIAEMLHHQPKNGHAPAGGAVGAPVETRVNLVSISKPIWFYGLEPLADQILPAKGPRLRRIAFAQLALPGVPEILEVAKRPEDELGRLSRAVPLWFAETFYFSPHYAPIAAVGLLGPHYALFGAEWTTDNLRQLVDTNKEPLDYIITGALRKVDDNYELGLRLWEVKKLRERKQFTARWSAATADAELTKLHEQVRLFMEWKPETNGLGYAPPASPRSWLDLLGASLTLFLGEKSLLPPEQLTSTGEVVARAASVANASERDSLAFITLRNRAERLQVAARIEAALSASPLIAQARDILP